MKRGFLNYKGDRRYSLHEKCAVGSETMHVNMSGLFYCYCLLKLLRKSIVYVKGYINKTVNNKIASVMTPFSSVIKAI